MIEVGMRRLCADFVNDSVRQSYNNTDRIVTFTEVAVVDFTKSDITRTLV